MMKYRLVTPGPMMAPSEALLELAKPIRHHRTPENKAMVAEAIAGLKKVFVTANDMVLLTSSGTGAMEASVANIIKPGDKTIVCSAGKWGERWIEINKAFGANIVLIEAAYGKAIEPQRVAEAVKANPDAVAVYATLCETSTAVAHDIEAMGEIVARSKAVFAVDGISGVGAMECRTDAWNIDLLAVGGQKAFMLPPGLAFLSVSPKARKLVEANSNRPAYYYDLKRALKAAADNDTPFTPAHTLIAALVQCLRLMLDEGIENIWRRTAVMARAMQAALAALNLELVAERPADGLSAVFVPEGISGKDWEKLLEKKYSLKVAGGQGILTGKIIRIAHMGHLDALDVVGIAAALEWSLLELGHLVEPGAAVAAASRSFAEEFVPAATAIAN